MRTSLFLLLLVFWAGSAPAHNLWVERTRDGLEVCYGHARAAHEGAKLIPYGEGFVRRLDCVDETGLARESGWTGAVPARVPGGCAAVFVLASSGFWSKTTEGTRNVPKTEAPSALKSWQSFESVKRIDRWGDGLAEPFTNDLEITPLANPLLLKPGSKIRLLVTMGGKPVEGATVTYDGEPRGLTGRDGRVNLKIRHHGFQAIQAGVTVPLRSEEADEAIHTTSLNFETGGTE